MDALHSTPIIAMCSSCMTDKHPAGHKRGFAFGGDRSASEAARATPRIAEMRDAWRNRQTSSAHCRMSSAAADAYEEKCKRLANAWRQR
jgi:hypothetical protein